MSYAYLEIYKYYKALCTKPKGTPYLVLILIKTTKWFIRHN